MAITPTSVGTINDTTATSHTFSGVTIAAGNLAIIRLMNPDISVSSVTDSAGNTWAIAIQQPDTPGGNRYAICYGVIVNGLLGGTITINFASTGTCGAYLSYYTADNGWRSQATVLDQTKGQTTSVAAWASGATSTTTQAEELLIGGAGKINFNGSTSTPGSGWTEENETTFSNVGGGSMVSQYQVVGATGAYNCTGTWGAAEFAACAIATFKTAAAGAPPPIRISTRDRSTRFGPF